MISEKDLQVARAFLADGSLPDGLGTMQFDAATIAVFSEKYLRTHDIALAGESAAQFVADYELHCVNFGWPLPSEVDAAAELIAKLLAAHAAVSASATGNDGIEPSLFVDSIPQYEEHATALAMAEARYDDAFAWGRTDECLRIVEEEIKPLIASQYLDAKAFADLVEVSEGIEFA